MNAILIFALLPLHAVAPSNFSVNGFASMGACNYARTEMTRQHAPFGRRIVLWSTCVPSAPPNTIYPNGVVPNAPRKD